MYKFLVKRPRREEPREDQAAPAEDHVEAVSFHDRNVVTAYSTDWLVTDSGRLRNSGKRSHYTLIQK